MTMLILLFTSLYLAVGILLAFICYAFSRIQKDLVRHWEDHGFSIWTSTIYQMGAGHILAYIFLWPVFILFFILEMTARSGCLISSWFQVAFDKVLNMFGCEL